MKTHTHTHTHTKRCVSGASGTDNENPVLLDLAASLFNRDLHSTCNKATRMQISVEVGTHNEVRK